MSPYRRPDQGYGSRGLTIRSQRIRGKYTSVAPLLPPGPIIIDGGEQYDYEFLHSLSASVGPEGIVVAEMTFPYTPEDPDELSAGVEPEDITVVADTVPHEADPDSLNASVTPESIRVQTV